jgi:hypothetical protein
VSRERTGVDANQRQNVGRIIDVYHCKLDLRNLFKNSVEERVIVSASTQDLHYFNNTKLRIGELVAPQQTFTDVLLIRTFELLILAATMPVPTHPAIVARLEGR